MLYIYVYAYKLNNKKNRIVNKNKKLTLCNIKLFYQKKISINLFEILWFYFMMFVPVKTITTQHAFGKQCCQGVLKLEQNILVTCY